MLDDEIIISGEQIYFKFITKKNIDLGWHDWINDKNLNKFLVSNKKYTKEDLSDYIKKSQPPSCYMFAVYSLGSDQYIGNARLSSIDYVNKKASYGRLMGGGYHGKGYGTESLKLLANFAFKNLGLHRIESGVNSNNISSIKSNIKAGAIQEGILKESVLVDGEFQDTILFAFINICI